MNDLERALEQVRPTIEAENFRHNLRRELLKHQANSNPQARPLLWPLLAVSGLASVMAVLLVLFVARPQVPAQLHAGITGKQPQVAPSMAMPSEQLQLAGDQVDPYLTSLLSDKRLSRESDKAFVSNTFNGYAQPEELQPIGGDSYLTVRQYRTPDGKRVMVYTPLIRQPEVAETY